MIESRTICREVALTGVGLHSGERVELKLKPSRLGRIIFRRLDLGGREVGADPRAAEARNCTSLRSGDVSVQTVEHLMAVLFICGVDSLEIELSASELPALDGSAAPLARAVLEAGIKPLPEKKRAVRILKPGTVKSGPAGLSFSPDSDFRISYVIEFDHPLIRRQEISLPLTRRGFLEEIAPARTFGFLSEVPELRRRGLARGGSVENAVVLDEDGVINGPLRFPDEFVRHKVLDIIGDLALFGHPLLGHFRAERAGHALHLQAVRFLLENPDYWTFEETAAPNYLWE